MHRVITRPGGFVVANKYNVTVSAPFTTRAAAQIEAARLDNPRKVEPVEREDMCPMTVSMSW